MPRIKLSDSLVAEAKLKVQDTNRSIASQIEHWVTIGKLVEDNPDLPYSFIKNILISQEEVKSGKTEAYTFDTSE